MLPTFEELNDAEREWVAASAAAGWQMVADYAPGDAGRPPDADALDRAYAAWVATGEADGERINAAVNAVAYAFGQLLIDAAGFDWVVATDQYGCEMALLALPGRGDVLVYPAAMLAKRWPTRETGFLRPLFDVITQQVRDVAAGWRPDRR